MKDCKQSPEEIRYTEPQRGAGSVTREGGLMTINLAFGSAAGLGGTERRMLDVVRELRLRGVRVRVLSPGPRDQVLTSAMAEVGAQIVTYRNPAQLVRLASGGHADATWAFGARAAYPLAVGRRLPTWRGGLLLIAKNGLEALRSRPSMVLERVLIRAADLVVANSRAAADHAVARSHARVERIRVLRSALSPEWTTSHKRGPRTLVRIAMIGNARPEKEHALGIRTFTQLNDPETYLTVYTNDGTALRKQLEDVPCHLRERVIIREDVSVTPEIVNSIDVLLHPSSSESLPRVALEARSQGTWVVGFDVGDLAPFCRSLIPWGDELGLVASLRSACSSVRVGDWPPSIEVPSVPAYTDRLVALICEMSARLRLETPS